MDGVPDLTQPSLRPGESFTYRFVTAQSGTYWFHPHMGLQLDRGLYAPLIVEERGGARDYDVDQVVVLDDWLDGIDTTPEKSLKSLTSMSGMSGMGDQGSGSMPSGGMTMSQSDPPPWPHFPPRNRCKRAPKGHGQRAPRRDRHR